MERTKEYTDKHITENIKARFWSRVKVGRKLECWDWVGPANVQGYGQFYINTTVLAHVVSYIIFNKVAKKDMCIDHICMNRVCVNPLHLREVTHRTNCVENSKSISAKNKAKTHCVNGHEFSIENTTYRNDKFTSRICKKCLKERNEKYKNRK